MTSVSSPAGLSIGGDIDEDAYAALVEALREIAQDRDEVHVDLSAVQYCDLAGLRRCAATCGLVYEFRSHFFVTRDRAHAPAELMFVSSDRTWPACGRAVASQEIRSRIVDPLPARDKGLLSGSWLRVCG